MKYLLVLLGASSGSAWWRVEFEAASDDDALYVADATLNHAVTNREISYEGYQVIRVADKQVIGEDGQYGD